MMGSRRAPRAGLAPLLAAIALAACAAPAVEPAADAASPAAQPDADAGPPAAPYAPLRALARFVDRDPDPGVVEVDLEAREAAWEYAPGRVTRALAYNGVVPGPLLEARVGDTVVVHFANRLTEPTTIHWHGVRVPNAMDGADTAQTPVPPGGTFEYRFTVPDAGTFWYHPHVDEPVQLERGLYGAIVVREREAPVAKPPANESVLLLDDLTVTADGQIAPPGGISEGHAGREGPVQLVNGGTRPELVVRAGERRILRVVNAGSARFYRLALASGAPLTLLGTDVGRLASPREVADVLLVPGDRVELALTPVGEPGGAEMLRALPVDRGQGAGTVSPIDLLRFRATSDAALGDPGPLPSPGAPLPPPLDTNGATVRRVVFDERTDPVTHAVIFLIDGQAAPDVPTLMTTLGTTEVWDLVNDSEMDHPFHLHGYFFQPLAREGAPFPFASWEDTLVLPARTTTRVAFRPDDRPGMWMYHCHILEHAAHGMMAHLHVME